MEWLSPLVDRLAAPRCWSYAPAAAAAAEPAALATLALAGHGRLADALRAGQWLAEAQCRDGSLGVTENQPEPGWPTGLAVLAWQALAGASDFSAHGATDRAIGWLLSLEGKTAPREPGGHDSTLVAWPWVAGTHSWVEPTAIALLALRSCGMITHPRAQLAARVLLDRLLPDGGCNYGNTVVLGQTLRPHVEPTAWAMLALGGLRLDDGSAEQERWHKSLDYLQSSVDAAASRALSLALLALNANGREIAAANRLLASKADRLGRFSNNHVYVALIALAALGERAPLASLVRSPWRLEPTESSNVKGAPG